MRSRRARLAALTLGAALATGCSGASPSIVGVWRESSSGAVATIRDDGTCSGMYYADGAPLDIGGVATCQLGEGGDGGSYPLVVEQPPNRASYTVTFDGDDTMIVDVGATTVEFARQ